VKRIKCTHGISAVNVCGTIVNFAKGPGRLDGTVVVNDYIADKLVKYGGYEIVPDKSLEPNILPQIVKHKPKPKQKKSIFGWLKQLFK